MTAPDKKSIRQKAFLLRDSITPELRLFKNGEIKKNLLALDAFDKAETVMLFASFRSEVDTFDIIKHCISIGKKTILPKADKDNCGLLLYEIENIGELEKGYFGILEPKVADERLTPKEKLDFIVVPGAAFDARCNRVGYGKGFYDRLLIQRTAPAFALAYEEQIFDSVPVDKYDVRLDGIITDERVISCDG
ncbi:MAG: 5-formyltetrahydrofolate cyclo-ligase [Nitrospirae bacterium]|nr:5-formyltetrahydrofolate cyclo-ligase [Nitrospirota bacterium]